MTEQQSVFKFQHCEDAIDHAITRVTKDGSECLKFHLKPNDVWADDEEKNKYKKEEIYRERAELRHLNWDQENGDGSGNFKIGEGTQEFSFEILVEKPINEILNKSALIIGQFMTHKSHIPAVSHRIEFEECKPFLFASLRHHDGYDVSAKIPLRGFEFDKWQDFRYKINWSYDDSGKIELFLNKKLGFVFHGRNLPNSEKHPHNQPSIYFKLGLYQNVNKTKFGKEYKLFDPAKLGSRIAYCKKVIIAGDEIDIKSLPVPAGA